MQAIIDIIKELIHGQLGFFNRGDPSAPDWNVTDFVQDGRWNTLDLSSIVPSDAQLVLFRLVLIAPAINNYLFFRTLGNNFTSNASRAGVQIAGHRLSLDVHVHPDTDRKIEYLQTGPDFSTINLVVSGWWLR